MARTTTSARTVPPGVTHRRRVARLPGPDVEHLGVLVDPHPVALDGVGQPPGEERRLHHGAVRRERRAEHAGGADRPRAVSSGPSQRRSSSPNPSARASSTSASARARWASLRTRSTEPPLTKWQSMPSLAALAPTTSTVSCMARRIARMASTPCWRASAASEVAKRAEHQPPLRPEAPKPATSRSSTAMRSEGSAWASACAVHKPVKPAPTMQTSTSRSSVSAGRGGSGTGTASHHRESRW